MKNENPGGGFQKGATKFSWRGKELFNLLTEKVFGHLFLVFLHLYVFLP